MHPATLVSWGFAVFPLKRSTAIIARTQCNFFVVTRQKLEGVISGYPEAQRLVLDFAKTKQEWWDRENKDGSTLQTNAFGAEFVHDIARENLKKLDIFASASDKLLTKVASVMTRHVIPAGTTIVRLNDDSNSIYFIVSGTVQVVGGVDSTVHAELSSGFFFGEVGVLMNLKRTANVRAKSECHIFELQKAHLNGLLKDCPGLKSALYRASIERYESFKKRCGGHLVVAVPTEETMFMVKSKRVTDEAHQPDQFDVEVGSQSLAKLSLFQGMDKSVLSELAMQMVRKTWSRNDQIITANETGNSSMYFLAAGTVDIYTEFGDLINSVSGPSAYFGEVALIEHVPRTATVKCASVCSTYELRQQDFERVMEMHPNLAFQIKETCDARMQAYLMRNVLA
ncbi:cyclic nucleotide-binding-like protein [Chytriomyces sp. MP71]|nr:cyclic nucleotide-binding-like protein [Chytriomyces sp. MP71]